MLSMTQSRCACCMQADKEGTHDVVLLLLLRCLSSCLHPAPQPLQYLPADESFEQVVHDCGM